MEPKIIYIPSAFKHGVSADNIRHALTWPEYEGPLEDEGDKRIVLGFDESGNLLEILYNQIDEETVKVFHAMKCRNIFYHLLDNIGETYAGLH